MITCVTAVIIGLKSLNRFKELKFFIIYPAASLMETFSSPIINHESPRLKAMGVPEMSTNVFLLIEFIIIFHFFLQVFDKKKIRKWLYAVMIIYLPTMLGLWVGKKTFSRNPSILFVPQAICVLIPTLYYFVQLLKMPSKLDLKNEPAFWIATGILIYFGCTLPLFLLNGIIDFSVAFERSIFSINFLCYAILFMLTIKAYSCKKREAQ